MKNCGFTLIELLVVVAVIGVLIAILLPAVHSVREAGRRTVCANNVKQLALAVTNYESTHHRLPVGLRSGMNNSGNGSDNYFGISWITRILPFIEQNALWNQTVEDYARFPVPFRSHRGMQTVLESVVCPSDPVGGRLQWTHENYLVACTDYLGVIGTNYANRDGLFTYDLSVRLADIDDGLSNTLLIGERPPSPDFWYGWWYATGAGTGDVMLGVSELNPPQEGVPSYLEDCPSGPYQFERGSNSQCDTLHFWSWHSGGANFAFADGSVQLIGYSIDQPLLEALATRAGGEVAVSP